MSKKVYFRNPTFDSITHSFTTYTKPLGTITTVSKSTIMQDIEFEKITHSFVSYITIPYQNYPAILLGYGTLYGTVYGRT